MTTKKTSTPKQQPAKKGATPVKKAAAKKGQPVPPADIATVETTQSVATPAEADAQQAPTAPAEATPATESAILVWPEMPTTEETDLAIYHHMEITACGRYRVYRSVARLTGADHHFNAEVRNGDNGYHTIEQAKDGCGRPRDYRTLNCAVEVCRLHFAGVQPGATSDEMAMFAHARAHGLDVLPPVSNGKPQTGDGQEATKRTRKASRPKADKPRKLSAIDAAAKVLAEAGKPMNCKEMIEMMATQGYWSSPGGLTPDATLYSSIIRFAHGATNRGGLFSLKGIAWRSAWAANSIDHDRAIPMDDLPAVKTSTLRWAVDHYRLPPLRLVFAVLAAAL